MATLDQRTHALSIMDWLIAHHPQVGYNQLRPMATKGLYEQDLANLFNKGGHIQPDCSECCTLICRMAGYKDPSGRGYDGYGDTETMYQHLPHYTDPRSAHAGALVVFGVPERPLAQQHVAMVMNPGADPTLFNHGSSAGPHQVLLSDLVSSMGNPSVTFLDVSHL